jgi:uncharacterized membrane protein
MSVRGSLQRDDDADLIVAWALTGVAVAAALAAGAALLPRLVYDRFLWVHVVGPLQAEAYGADCVALIGGSVEQVGGACSAASTGGLVATPGLTPLGAVWVGLVSLFLLLGGFLALSRLGVARGRQFLYATVPFMFVGGAILAVGDVGASLPGGASALAGYPFNLALTGPVLLVLVLLCPVVVLLVAWAVASRGFAAGYGQPAGIVAALLFGGLVGYLATITGRGLPAVGFGLLNALLVVGLATALTVVVWAVVARLSPGVVTGIGPAGLVVTWAYVLSGVVTVVAVDWSARFGFAVARPPSVVDASVAALTGAVLPPGVTAVTRLTWPYLLVQLFVALLVASSVREESLEVPAVLLLVVAAVGVAVVPATRTLLLLALGI